MNHTLLYLAGTCLPGLIFGCLWGFAKCGLIANSHGFRPNTDKWYVRIMFESSSVLPIGLQLVYGFVLFLSFWVIAFLFAYPMKLLSNPPPDLVIPHVIFVPFILYPCLFYFGYRFCMKKCIRLIEQYT